MITAVPTCDSPGVLQDGEIEESILGYGYKFQVYVPPCYEQEVERQYPVLYLLPGYTSNYTVWSNGGLYDIADEMISTGQVPPFIIVATGNNDVDLMGEVVHVDLVPYIDSHYRTLNERPYRAVAGGSLGGSRAYRLALTNPEIFASAGVFGNGLIPGEEEKVAGWLEAIPAEMRPRFFFNSGFQDPYMLNMAKELIKLLDDAGFETTSLFTEGGHSNAYWITNMPTYWQWLSEDWK